VKTVIGLVCLLAGTVFFMLAFAGEEPYKAVVDEDVDVPSFYVSDKLAQFLHPGTAFSNEVFDSQHIPISPEVCCTEATVSAGLCPSVPNSLTGAGNSGWYEWRIQLPKEPVGEMNLELECGVLKPGAFAIWEDRSIELCAAETGEIIGPNCTRRPRTCLKASALPAIEAVAYPGCQNAFTPFHLTAYRNPGTYAVTRDAANHNIRNSVSLQVLDGGPGARIALKGCMDKTVLVKLPMDGELNVWGEYETDLRAGDIIEVRMVVPTANTVDIYCSRYSARIGGIGDTQTLLPDYLCEWE